MGEDLRTVADFTVTEGQRIPFTLDLVPLHEEPPRRSTPSYAIQDTEA